MPSPFDVVCVAYHEKTGMYSAVHLVETGEDWQNVRRTVVNMWGLVNNSKTPNYEIARETMLKLAAHFGVQPENVVDGVVYPVNTSELSDIVWSVPNWVYPVRRPFQRVFPGRALASNAWSALLQEDDFG